MSAGHPNYTGHILHPPADRSYAGLFTLFTPSSPLNFSFPTCHPPSTAHLKPSPKLAEVPSCRPREHPTVPQRSSRPNLNRHPLIFSFRVYATQPSPSWPRQPPSLVSILWKARLEGLISWKEDVRIEEVVKGGVNDGCEWRLGGQRRWWWSEKMVGEDACKWSEKMG